MGVGHCSFADVVQGARCSPGALGLDVGATGRVNDIVVQLRSGHGVISEQKQRAGWRWGPGNNIRVRDGKL